MSLGTVFNTGVNLFACIYKAMPFEVMWADRCVVLVVTESNSIDVSANTRFEVISNSLPATLPVCNLTS
jgi:hypothetical protein